MTLTISLFVAILSGAITFSIGIFFIGWIIASLLNSYTNDSLKNYRHPASLINLFERLPLIGDLASCLKQTDDMAEALSDFFLLFLVFVISAMVVSFCTFIALYFWPIACLIILGYFLLRLVRFARRTKKSLAPLIQFAHRHTRAGNAKKVPVDTPEF